MLLFSPAVNINLQITFSYTVSKLCRPIVCVRANVHLSDFSDPRPSWSDLLPVLTGWSSLTYPHTQHLSSILSVFLAADSSVELFLNASSCYLEDLLGIPETIFGFSDLLERLRELRKAVTYQCL